MNRGMTAAVAALAASLAGLLPMGAARAQATASDFTSGTRYDAARRVVGTIAPDPDGAGPLRHAAVRNVYDAAGRLVRTEAGELSDWQSEVVAPAAWTGFSVSTRTDVEYDALDRKVKETLSSGGAAYRVTQYGYDAVGRLECTAERMNLAAFGSLPTSACTLGTPGGSGADRITRNVYDAGGRVTKVQKAYGTPLQQDYATYGYTANGRQASVTDANGNRAEMGYTGFDELGSWSFPSATTPGAVSPSDYESYAYDANGNRTEWRKRDGRVFSYSFDALDRITAKIVPEGCPSVGSGTCLGADRTRDVYYGYDARGAQTYARFDGPAGADGVVSEYDGFGELTASTTAMYGTSRTLRFRYDADGNRTRIEHPDGRWFRYVHDGLDRHLQTFGDNDAQYGLQGYDASGRMASRFGGAVTYAYDGIGRLQSQTMLDLTGAGNGNTTTFGYNPAAQIAARTRSNDGYAFTGGVAVDRAYAVNGLNQYVSAGPASFGYDANGNLLSDGTTAYGYDAENRLILTGGQAYLYYDPLGRLWQSSTGQTGVTQFVYDGDALAAEYDGANTLLRRYVHGTSADVPEQWFEGAGLADPHYLFADHQGSIVATFQPSVPRTAINAYDEYGIPDARNVGRFGYTGQAWIPELGMYYYKARMYSPTLGRFLQTDPIGYDDQINLYSYVGNDPVNQTDPSGMCTGTILCTRSGESLSPFGIGTSGLGGAFNATPPGKKIGSVGRGGDGRVLSPQDNGAPADDPPAARSLTAWGKMASVLGALLSLGGDSCASCHLSIEGIMRSPDALTNVTLDQFRAHVGTPSGWVWTRSLKGANAGKGWALREWGGRDWTGRQIRWHPGGSTYHGPDSYWRVNNGNGQAPVIPSGGRW